MIHDLVSDSVFEEKRNEEIQKEKTDNNPFLQMKPVPSEIGTQGKFQPLVFFEDPSVLYLILH